MANKLLEILDISLSEISKFVQYSENIPIDSEASNYLAYYLQQIGEIVTKTSEEIEKFKKENNITENKMDEKKIREFIRMKIHEFLAEKKVLAEAKEKDGKGKPTSGLTKAKSGDTHTEKTKSKNPPAKKVTDGGPENKTLANAEPTPVDNEVKVMKEKDEPKKDDSTFEMECMGVELKVKGASHAAINHLYLIGQIRKSLEGRGPRVNKVEIEMGEPKEKKDVKESKEVQKFREKIRGLIKEELKKKV